MTSEIRANIIKNRVGLGTIEYSNTGPIISGVTTALNFKTGTSNLHNTGLSVQDLDVDGHTNLDNVSIAGVTTMSGNLTISNTDPRIIFVDTNNNPDFTLHANGGDMQVENSGSGTQVKLESSGSTRLFGNVIANKDLDVDGHTNLDNVNIAGVTSVANLSSGRVVIAGAGGKLEDSANLTFSGSTLTAGGFYVDGTQNASLTSNQLIFDRPGYSYIDQTSDTGSLVFRVTSGNTIALRLDNSAQAHFGSSLIIPDAIQHNGDLDCKIRFPATDTISFETASNERLRIKSNGKIGINNNNPTHPLHIVNTSSTFNSASLIKGDTSTSGGGAYVTFTNTADSKSAYFGVDGNGLFNINAGAALVGTNGDESIIFCTNGNSQKARITSNGLIETASTFGIANVGGSVAGSGGLENWIGFKDSSGNFGLIMKTASQTAGYVRNVGINETNPRQRLHVHDDTNYQGILINGNSAPRIAFARSTTTTGEWSVGIDGTNGNNFCINRSNDNSNRLFVIGNGQTNSNQNTVVNGVFFNNDIRSTTSTNDDSTSNVKISARNAAGGHGNYCIIGVSGNTYFGAGASSYSSNPSGNNINGGTTIRVYGGISSNAYQDAHRFGRDTDGSIVIFQSAGGTEGSIAISGSTTNYNTSSDYRLKENIVNITDGITRLKQLKPRRFNFIKDPSITKDGFIAHEVDSVVPEAVTGTKDETFSKDDEANNVKAGDPKYQHMDASKLIPLITAALQEAITEIETLKTKVAALEG